MAACRKPRGNFDSLMLMQQGHANLPSHSTCNLLHQTICLKVRVGREDRRTCNSGGKGGNTPHDPKRRSLGQHQRHRWCLIVSPYFDNAESMCGLICSSSKAFRQIWNRSLLKYWTAKFLSKDTCSKDATRLVVYLTKTTSPLALLLCITMC